MNERILLTGGAGFIGSHTCVALVAAGYEVTILDNFENARRDVPDKLAEITGKPVPVIDCDIRDREAVSAAFSEHEFDAVVHFAALKSVGDGEANPVGYNLTNCAGLINIVAAMQEHQVHTIVFSSSASVYGSPEILPISEDCPPAPHNVYARTKLFGEEFLKSAAAVDPAFRTGILRYFNPVGAHPSGLIGEDSSQKPTNLMPVMARVATGELDKLSVFGGDYATPDGSGVRDYIHVLDLAEGHVLSLQALLQDNKSHLVNLGTGRGYSVLEMVAAYSKASGCDIPYQIVDRRPGDGAVSYADPALAQKLLGFEARYDLQEMCESSWQFVKRGRQ